MRDQQKHSVGISRQGSLAHTTTWNRMHCNKMCVATADIRAAHVAGAKLHHPPTRMHTIASNTTITSSIKSCNMNIPLVLSPKTNHFKLILSDKSRWTIFCFVLISGGNLDRSDTRFANSKTFGNVPANVRSNSRILSLSHTKDSEGKSEWYWQTSECYQSLDVKYKLPNLLR